MKFPTDSERNALQAKAWLPDLLFAEGRLQRGLALVADPKGNILKLSREPTDLAKAVRLGGRAMFPGFVNAHSHSFQRAIRGRTEYRTNGIKDTFWTWREKMYHAAQAMTPEDIHATARMCFLEMVLAGITTVGEFHYLHHSPDGTEYADPNFLAKEVLRAAREVGLRIAILHVGYARAGWNRSPNPGQRRFLYKNAESFLERVDALQSDVGRLYSTAEAWVGIAPHSLRAVTLDDFRKLNAYGRKHGMPVHMHVSEQCGENEDCLQEYGDTPIGLLSRDGQLHERFTAIHAVHVSVREIRALGRAWANVCACPTTERNLGDGIVKAHSLFKAGVTIALGSDSQIQIDPLEDARQLECHLRLTREERAVLADDSGDPNSLAGRLLSSATFAGARVLAAPGGILAPGKSADFFTVDLSDPSIAGCGESLGAMVFSLGRPAIRDVAVGGRLIVQDRRHPMAEPIVRDFEAVQTRLWKNP